MIFFCASSFCYFFVALDTCASVLMVRCFCDKWCEVSLWTRDLIKLKTQSVWGVAWAVARLLVAKHNRLKDIGGFGIGFN